MHFNETKLLAIAPNLCALVGKACAAKMVAAAGGLEELSKTPACNIQAMGSSKKNLLGASKLGKNLYHGFFGELEAVKTCPTDFQTRLVRMLANGSAKAAKFDQAKTAPDGSLGKRLHDETFARFEKIQEPTFQQKPKPFVLDIDKPKRRRGGKKYRKMKERLGMTEVRTLRNRMLMDPSNVISVLTGRRKSRTSSPAKASACSVRATPAT